jgi:hypothetical protein
LQLFAQTGGPGDAGLPIQIADVLQGDRAQFARGAQAVRNCKTKCSTFQQIVYGANTDADTSSDVG